MAGSTVAGREVLRLNPLRRAAEYALMTCPTGVRVSLIMRGHKISPQLVSTICVLPKRRWPTGKTRGSPEHITLRERQCSRGLLDAEMSWPQPARLLSPARGASRTSFVIRATRTVGQNERGRVRATGSDKAARSNMNEPARSRRAGDLSWSACMTRMAVRSRKTASMSGWFRRTAILTNPSGVPICNFSSCLLQAEGVRSTPKIAPPAPRTTVPNLFSASAKLVMS
jgi:hypothetical protein